MIVPPLREGCQKAECRFVAVVIVVIIVVVIIVVVIIVVVIVVVLSLFLLFVFFTVTRKRTVERVQEARSSRNPPGLTRP